MFLSLLLHIKLNLSEFLNIEIKYMIYLSVSLYSRCISVSCVSIWKGKCNFAKLQT